MHAQNADQNLKECSAISVFIHQSCSISDRRNCYRDSDLVRRYSTCIHANAFSTDDAGQQIGFGLHLADVYIPELLKVDQMALPSSLPHEQCVSLLQPFIAVLAKSKQPTLMNRIR